MDEALGIIPVLEWRVVAEKVPPFPRSTADTACQSLTSSDIREVIIEDVAPHLAIKRCKTSINNE